VKNSARRVGEGKRRGAAIEYSGSLPFLDWNPLADVYGSRDRRRSRSGRKGGRPLIVRIQWRDSRCTMVLTPWGCGSSVSLPGPVSESPPWLTIGSEGWPVNIIILRSSFSVGPSTDRGAVGTLPAQMNFLDAALNWFGDLDPRIGTAWEKGERLAKLEALQNPPGPQEAWLRELSLQAILPQLGAFNRGLCVITTRIR
jgi:hypothetical protein